MACADATDNAVACAAFRLCYEEGAENIGIGWGSMMGRMADSAEPGPGERHEAGRLFPLIGGIGASYRGYHTNELARIISGKAGYEAEYLYLPAFFDSEAELDFAARPTRPSRRTVTPWSSRSSTSQTSPPTRTSASNTASAAA